MVPIEQDKFLSMYIMLMHIENIGSGFLSNSVLKRYHTGLISNRVSKIIYDYPKLLQFSMIINNWPCEAHQNFSSLKQLQW